MNPQDVQHIVLEVLRRLQAEGGALPAALDDAGPAQPTTSLASVGGTSGLPVSFAKTKYTPTDAAPRAELKSRGDDDGVLLCDDRLLTLAKLESRLDSLRRVIVRRNTVITPSVKEELSRRNIAIERDGARPGTDPSFALSVVRYDADRAPALHGLGLAEDVHAKTLAVLVNQVASHLASGQRHVLVLTRQTALVACVLNRAATVRAAIVQNVEGVKNASRSLAANVLVVDPRALGRVQIAALLRAFENEGLRSPPADLAALLE
jgi:hypothetical protein